jgi:hypothetical protein
VCDGYEPSGAPRTELDHPAIVCARIRLRQLEVLALRHPENAQRRVEDGRVEVLVVEPRGYRGVADHDRNHDPDALTAFRRHP